MYVACNNFNGLTALPEEKAPVRGASALKKVLDYGEDWTRQIKELETFFNSVELPLEPIKLDIATTIINIPEFIDSHLQMVKHNNGNSYFSAYLQRLYLLKD